MKTDKFEESIRQKLEGIDPPFRESNWVHFRSVLRRNGVPSIGGTVTQWLVPMMSAASVAGLLVLAVWQYRTNQQLEQSVRSLKDSVTILQQLPQEVPVATAPRVDTVYITREVLVPQRIPTAPQYRPGEPSESRFSEDRRETGLASEPSSESIRQRNGEDVASPVRRSDGRLYSEESETPERLSDSSNERRETGRPTGGRSYSVENERSGVPSGKGQKADRERWNRADDRRYSGRQKPAGLETTRLLSGIPSNLENQPEERESATGSSASRSISWEPVSNRQFVLDSSYYVENFQRRVRRIRPLYLPSATRAIAAASPAKPEIEEPTSRVRFRLGGGGEIAGGQSGFGLAGEFLVGNHLSIGVGLTRLNLAGDSFLNDRQYNEKRNGNFRKDFPGKVPVDPRIEVLNISQKAKSWQLPITLGYRLPIGNDVTILPSAGLSFSLSTREQITFTHRKSSASFEFMPAYFDKKCTPSLYNSWLVSLGVEKQAGSWALQIMPYLSNPLSSSRNSLNQTTAGFRARIMYQF